MKMSVEKVIDRVREALCRQRGNWLQVLGAILKANPSSPITYRWLTALAAAQDKEPKFSRVVELASALGISVSIEVNHTEVKHGIPRSGRPSKRPRNRARGGK